MLVLERRVGQEVVIGGARLRVLLLKRGSVKLGIDAPPGVRVMRTELLEDERAKGCGDGFDVEEIEPVGGRE